MPCPLRIGLLTLSVSFFGSLASGAEPPARPNLVFLYTDDQARWAVGAYGNREVQTPSLDRLAREGALFRNAFTCTPVCSPSRAGMFTSRYPTQVRIDDWINPSVEPDLGLDPSAILWPELLKANGYASALLGKWHLGTQPQFHPTRQGYDHFFGFLGGGNTPMNPTLEVAGKPTRLIGSLPDLLVDEAIRFLESHRNGPFLLSVHFRAPHAPYAPVPEVDSAPFRDLDPTIPDVPGLPRQRVKQLTREYYASVHSVDRNVGRLLDRLDALGLTNNTIVIFTSDHGYMIGHHGLWHKGNASWLVEGKTGRRPNMFDDAIRVPLLVRWPGVVRPGSVVDPVVSNLDLFPSILEMVGLGVPENLRVEGRSFVPLLRGESITWDDTLFGQYDMHHGAQANMRMIRTPEWKLIRHLEPGGSDELYDLAHDPGETRNLADSAEHRDRLSTLSARLGDWMASIRDPRAGK
ncbi:MAG: sulfatase-like hydrolase/transferase [Isosphaeraceae bacterium]|nr:sulfatase-like hydrolase/transferase [Isosphaeraceae bacterium]